MVKILTEVEKYLQCLEVLEKKEGKKIIAFIDEAMKEGSELYQYYEKLSEIIHTIESNEDFVYQEVYNCLNYLNDNIDDSNDFESIRDNISEGIDSEVDVYTSDLTEWLNSSNYNVYYLTQALTEFEEKDGFKALAIAQSLAINEIWQEVLNLFNE